MTAPGRTIEPVRVDRAPVAPAPRRRARWRRRSTASSPPARPGRSATSCSRSPRPRPGTPPTGRSLLGDRGPGRFHASLRSRLLALLARRFGSVFVLALAQRAESRSPYDDDADATPTMAADEKIHAEVVRGLAERGRAQISGTFRAAVFGANDGLVSNLALVLGVAGSGVATTTVLLTGLAGLLSGALSMGAGEFISVRSQRELLDASTPAATHVEAYPHLDVDANELALVYRARGMAADEAAAPRGRAAARPGPPSRCARPPSAEHELVGSGLAAAVSSFLFFASGALVPVLPFLLGLAGTAALVTAAVLVGAALMVTGAVVGMLSGAPPLRRALRQLAVGAARRDRDVRARLGVRRDARLTAAPPAASGGPDPRLGRLPVQLADELLADPVLHAQLLGVRCWVSRSSARQTRRPSGPVLAQARVSPAGSACTSAAGRGRSRGRRTDGRTSGSPRRAAAPPRRPGPRWPSCGGPITENSTRSRRERPRACPRARPAMTSSRCRPAVQGTAGWVGTGHDRAPPGAGRAGGRRRGRLRPAPRLRRLRGPGGRAAATGLRAVRRRPGPVSPVGGSSTSGASRAAAPTRLDGPGEGPWWRVEAVRAYAAHTPTPECTEALARVSRTGTRTRPPSPRGDP